MSNPKADLHNINAHTGTKFDKNTLRFTQVIALNVKYGDVLQADNSVFSNHKSGLHHINAHSKSDENPLIFTIVIIWKWKYWHTANNWCIAGN